MKRIAIFASGSGTNFEALVNETYKNKYAWARMSLINIARSNVFSSDRSIEDYNDRIWHLTKIK